MYGFFSIAHHPQQTVIEEPLKTDCWWEIFLRAYIRASTTEQNAECGKESLIYFAHNHGKKIVSFYIENGSGATLTGPELVRLIADAGEGDIIIVEQIDRLARLKQAD